MRNPLYRNILKNFDGTPLCFRIEPEPCNDDLKNVIELAGGVVLLKFHEMPTAVRIFDAVAAIKLGHEPPLGFKGEIFSSSFVIDSYLKNEMQHIAKYRLPEEDCEVNKEDIENCTVESQSQRIYKNKFHGLRERYITRTKSKAKTSQAIGDTSVISHTGKSLTTISTNSPIPKDADFDTSSSEEFRTAPTSQKRKRRLILGQNAAAIDKVAFTPMSVRRESTNQNETIVTGRGNMIKRRLVVTSIGSPAKFRKTNDSDGGSLFVKPVIPPIEDKEAMGSTNLTQNNVSRTCKKSSRSQPKRQIVECSTGELDSDSNTSWVSSVSRVTTVSVDPRKEYTVEEGKKMLEFICSNNLHPFYKGTRPWKQMVQCNILPGRTFSSLMEHFRKKVYPNRSRIYGCSQEDMQKFETERKERRGHNIKRTAPSTLAASTNSQSN